MRGGRLATELCPVVLFAFLIAACVLMLARIPRELMLIRRQDKRGGLHLVALISIVNKVALQFSPIVREHQRGAALV